MSQLIVYRENDEFIIECINKFNHSTKRKFSSETALYEGIKAYQLIADQLDLKIEQDITLENGESLLWRVANTLFEDEIVTHETTVQTFSRV